MVHDSIRRMQGKERLFELFIWFLGAFVFLIVAYPLWFVVIASISDPGAVSYGRVWVLPSGLNVDGYQAVFKDSRIWIGYRTTLITTSVGTLLSMFVTIPCAYALSRKDFKARRPLMVFFVFTMYFSGGLIPTYITITQMLGLDNQIWVMIIPFCMNVYNLIVCRSFFESALPQELLESARLDGCSNTRFFLSIALPLSKAILSVIMLYYVVLRWNDYFTALIYVRSE
ncbi:MAG: carbohydrate ABC transporter permease, partial [Bacillota bacterium]